MILTSERIVRFPEVVPSSFGSNDKRGGYQQRQQLEVENAVHAGLAGGAETKLREGLKDGTKEIRE